MFLQKKKHISKIEKNVIYYIQRKISLNSVLMCIADETDNKQS